MSTKRTLVAVIGTVLAVVLLAACGASNDSGSPGDEPTPPTSSSGAQPQQSDEAWTELELAVLDALSYDPHPKDARYEPENKRVVVTLYTLGDDLTDSEIHNLEAAGEKATDDVDVVIEPTDEDQPSEDDSNE